MSVEKKGQGSPQKGLFTIEETSSYADNQSDEVAVGQDTQTSKPPDGQEKLQEASRAPSGSSSGIGSKGSEISGTFLNILFLLLFLGVVMGE